MCQEGEGVHRQHIFDHQPVAMASEALSSAELLNITSTHSDLDSFETLPTLSLLTPKNREYFLLTFLLMFTILIVMFIAWRVKRLLSFLSASITTTTVCSAVPFLFMSHSSCRYREYYESSIHYVNGFMQLRIYSMCFLPVCLLLRLMLTNWPIYLYTFTLIGSPFIILFGLAEYLDILLALQDVERSNRLFQTLQLHMFAFIVITFSGIWILLGSVEMYAKRGYWRCWKWNRNTFLTDQIVAAGATDLEKAPIEGDETASIDEPPEYSGMRVESRKVFSKSHTTTRLVKFSHQWTIDEFIRCDHRSGAPKFIDSIPFASPDNEEMRLFLRLYPRGRLSSSTNRIGESAVSLYLHYLPSLSVKEVTIGFVCSIIDKSGAKCDLHERRELFSCEQDSHGWDNFIYRSTLLNSRFLLPGEKLTINCEVSYAIDDLFTFESIV